MKFLHLIAFSFLFPLLVTAQANYHAGYVVLNSGDTTRGYINSREWETTPKTIEFKKNISEQKAVVYVPTALKSFGVINVSRYISYVGKISMDPTDLNNAPSGLDTTTRQDTVFLKVIYQGSKVSLLSNSDIIKQRLFIQETGQEPVELRFRRFLNGDNTLISSAVYKGQLRYIASQYNASEKTIHYIDGIDYNIGDIEKAVIYINGDRELPKEASISRFFIGGGVVYQSTSFQGDNSFTKAGNSHTVSPVISLGYDFFQNPHTQRLVFRAELLLSYNAPKFSYPVYYTANPATATYGFNQLTATLNPQFIYNIYNADALKIYVNVGLGLNFSSYSNNKLTVNGDFPETHSNYYDLKGFWATFPFKVGAVLNKRLDIFAMYIPNSPYTNYVNFSIGTGAYGLGVHYCFEKSKDK